MRPFAFPKQLTNFHPLCRFEGIREYRSPNRGRDSYKSLVRARESGKLSTHDKGARRSLQEHDEIIKEAAKSQISSLKREIEHLQRNSNNEKAKQVIEIGAIGQFISSDPGTKRNLHLSKWVKGKKCVVVNKHYEAHLGH